jgi:hypothetical protein
VLLELGDPDRLAAGYSGRALFLIGPALFLDYWRLLIVLLWTVVPIVFATLTVIGLVSGESAGELFASATMTTLSVAIHLVFWTTLGFAVLERTGTRRSVSTPWTLASLPALPTKATVSFADTAWTIAALLMTIVAFFVQQNLPLPRLEGRRVPLLNPELWTLWLPVLIALLVLEIVFTVVRYRIGHWTYPLAAVHSVLTLGFGAVSIGLLAGNHLFNPAFFAALGWPGGDDAGGWLTLLSIAVIALTSVWSSIEGFYRASRR